MSHPKNVPLSVAEAFVAIEEMNRQPLQWRRAAGSALLNLTALSIAVLFGVVLGSRRP